MRRHRRKKHNSIAKLGLLFTIMIICFASLSASYSHWEEKLNIYADMETTEWDDKTLEIRIAAFEDLGLDYEGCSHGWWKNHENEWFGYSPTQTVGSIFPGSYLYNLQDDTLHDALRYNGGDDLPGAAQILLRNAVGSILNAAHPDVYYIYTETEIQTIVNNALASQDRDTMINLNTELDYHNNLGSDLCCGEGSGIGNDWDYNDFIVDLNMTGYYIHNDPILVQLNLIFEAMARGAAYHHDYSFFLPPGFFGCNSTAVINYYETDGTHISTNTINYEDEDPILITIFSNTWTALPPTAGHPWAANTIDDTGIHPGRITTVEFTFEGFFCVNELNLDDYTLDYVGVHGHNLFFDTPLHVWDTGEIIHKGDDRYLVTPNNWEWPQERAPIWDVYPYNPVTDEGVSEGRSPPVFTQHWYTETPTTQKWDP